MTKTVKQVLKDDYNDIQLDMAEAYGVNRTTIYRWIKAGYSVNEYGEVIKVMGVLLGEE